MFFHHMIKKSNITIKLLTTNCTISQLQNFALLVYRFIQKDASTAASQELSHLSNTTATLGLTSKFGMGLGRALTLWPA
jgi:hypothetical protein